MLRFIPVSYTHLREDADGGYMTDLQYLTGVEYKLKVVGVFYASYTGDGLPYQIYVSNETGQKIEEMAVRATNDSDFIEQYKKNKKNPAMHSYTVLADSYENFNAVRQEIGDMGYRNCFLPSQHEPTDSLLLQV